MEKEKIVSGSKWARYIAIGVAVVAAIIFGYDYFSTSEVYENTIQVQDKVVLLYSEKIDVGKSKQVADAIKESGFLKGSEGAELFLGPGNLKYQLMFVLPNPGMIKDSSFLRSFHEFEDFINLKVKLDKEISVCFTDLDMTKVYVLPDFQDEIMIKKKTLNALPVFSVNEVIHVYHNEEMAEADLIKLKEVILGLPGYFPPDQAIDMIFLDEGTYFSIKFFVIREYWNESEITEMLKSTVDYISAKDMGKPIRLMMIDNRDYTEKQL